MVYCGSKSEQSHTVTNLFLALTFTPEDIRYLKVAIALALGSDDILEMPKTKTALNELYHKIERMQGNKDQLFQGALISWDKDHEVWNVVKVKEKGESEITLEMKKVVTFSSPPLPKDQLDKLISALIQEERSKWSLEWALNDDGTLDIFTE
jgi:hypothetical protein